MALAELQRNRRTLTATPQSAVDLLEETLFRLEWAINGLRSPQAAR
jgi:hypothetical protein